MSGAGDDVPELADPHRLMVLYSADELRHDSTDTLDFWRRIFTHHCSLHHSLTLHIPSLVRDYTRHDLHPTSLELSIPLLIKDSSVVWLSDLKQSQSHYSTHSLNNSVSSDSLSCVISRLMSMSFATDTHTHSHTHSHTIVPLCVLEALASDVTHYTRTLPEKSRVHYMPTVYTHSSLAQYLSDATRVTSSVLPHLQWEDVLLLLHYMQRTSRVVISEDNKYIKFIAPDDVSECVRDEVSTSVWSPLKWLVGAPTVTHTLTHSLMSDPTHLTTTITATDKWALKLVSSMHTLTARVNSLEERMKQYRTQAARYKSGRDIYMAKICLKKLLFTRKQRDATAVGLMKLEMLEQNIAECETQKVLISSYQLATQAMKQARVVTNTHTQTRTLLHSDGTTSSEEVVVGSVTHSLTVEDVEEAMSAFEEEAEIASEISQQLASSDVDNCTSEDMSELEAELDALVDEYESVGECVGSVGSTVDHHTTTLSASVPSSDKVILPAVPTHSLTVLTTTSKDSCRDNNTNTESKLLAHV